MLYLMTDYDIKKTPTGYRIDFNGNDDKSRYSALNIEELATAVNDIFLEHFREMQKFGKDHELDESIVKSCFLPRFGGLIRNDKKVMAILDSRRAYEEMFIEMGKESSRNRQRKRVLQQIAEDATRAQ